MVHAWMGHLLGDRSADDLLRLMADHYARSLEWVRERLRVPRRSPGGARQPNAAHESGRPPAQEHRPLVVIRPLVGLAATALLTRHRSATETNPATCRHERVDTAADQEVGRAGVRSQAAWGPADATDHLDEIRAAYWAGESLSELALRWGVSQKTITTWIYRG